MIVPPAPVFGEPVADQTSPEVLAFLARRRSASAMALTAPGPRPAELDDLLRLAARIPDHGKLNPWRFLILSGGYKDEFAGRLLVLAQARPDSTKAIAALGKLRNPPLAVVVISSPVVGQIPFWEQQLSAGAVCNQMLNAATAMGYGANWITDWYAFDEAAVGLLGLSTGEQVAGFIYIGNLSQPPHERARPDISALTRTWQP